MEKIIQNNLIEMLKKWQNIEDSAIHTTTDIISQNNNPFIQLIMEIIRHDSTMHYRVLQFLLAISEEKTFSIDFEGAKNLINKLKDHEETEKQAIIIAERAITEIDSPVVRYLLEYLLTDEKKHDVLIENVSQLIESKV